MAFTSAQRRVFALAPKPPAAGSFVASACVAVQILRDPAKRSTMYHRLVLGMSACSMVQSASYFCGTWAMPRQTSPGTHWALGTVKTCSAQGFLVQLSTFSVSCYYASLSLYSLLAVRHDFRRERFGWIEPFIHCGVYVFPLVSAIVILRAELFNPAGFCCWIEVYPVACGVDGSNVDCVRGNAEVLKMANTYFAMVPIFLLLGFATIMMLALYLVVRRKEARENRLLSNIEEEGRGGKIVGRPRRLDRAAAVASRKKLTRVVARQASVYLAAFYATYLFIIVTRLTQMLTGIVPFTTLIASIVMLSLQGFLNSVVYVALQVRRTPTPPPAEPPTEGSDEKHSSAAEATQLADKPRKRSSLEGGDVGRNCLRRDSFSIFDGRQQPSVQWKEFVFQDDDDGEYDPYDYSDGTTVSNQPISIVEDESPAVATGGYDCDTISTRNEDISKQGDEESSACNRRVEMGPVSPTDLSEQ